MMKRLFFCASYFLMPLGSSFNLRRGREYMKSNPANTSLHCQSPL